MADDRIESYIIDFIRDAPTRGDIPTRENAIFFITGKIDVLPSAVAKVFSAMVASGKIKHISGDRIVLPD